MRLERVSLPFLPILLLAAGCGDNSVGPADEAAPDLTDPAAVLACHQAALTEGDLSTYLALLERAGPARSGGFRFYPRPDDDRSRVGLPDGFWGYDLEAAMIGNLLGAVSRIEMESEVVHEAELEEGVVQRMLHVSIRTYAGDDPKSTSDTILDFVLARDERGFYRIRSIREWAKPGRDELPPLPPDPNATWASVKREHRPRIRATTVEGVIDQHFRAISDRDFFAYEDALCEDFEFCPRDEDFFPWMPDGCWDLAVELAIMANMTNPQWIGDERPVRFMEANYTIMKVRRAGPGAWEVRTDAIVLVLVGEDTGWRTDTRFVFLVNESADGSFCISRIEEHALRLGAREEASWASIKNLYH